MRHRRCALGLRQRFVALIDTGAMMRGKRIGLMLAAGLVAAATVTAVPPMSTTALASEYKWWHDLIGATRIIQNRMNRGEGVTVGVLDSLTNPHHREFEERTDSYLAPDGWYTVENDAGRLFACQWPGPGYHRVTQDTGCVDLDGNFYRLVYRAAPRLERVQHHHHGTHVTGIINAARDGRRMVGIAPAARAINVGVLDAFGSVRNERLFRRSFRFLARRGASIVNMSLGFGPVLANRDMLRAISNSHEQMVAVKAAGNEGQALADAIWNLEKNPLGNLLVVGAVNRNKKLASFSNRPGGACIKRNHDAPCTLETMLWQRWLVAPGTRIVSTTADGRYTRMSGTSMAAPMVAGAAALLQSHWTFLEDDPETTADILLDTAENIGPVRRFGRGLLRVDRAMRPQGPIQIPIGEFVGGDSHAGDGSLIHLSSALGTGASILSALDGVVVFDRYGRDFPLDPTATVLAAPGAALSLHSYIEQRFEAGSQLLTVPVVHGAGATVSFTTVTDATDAHSGLPAHAQFAPDSRHFGSHQDRGRSWRMAGEIGNLNFAFGQRAGLVHDVNVAKADTLFLLDAEASSQPLLTMGEQWIHGFARYRMTDRFGIGMGYADLSGGDMFGSAEAGSGRAYLVQAEVAPMENLTLQVTQTVLEESNMMLGSASTGALGLGSGAMTLATGAALSLDLPASIQARVHFTHATTESRHDGLSLFRKVGPLYSRSYGASLTKRGVFGAHDQIGLSVNKPLHVYSGKAVLDTPVGRTREGRVTYRRNAVALAPQASQTDFDIGYRARLAPELSFGLNVFYQHDVNHQPGKWNAGGLTEVRLSF